MASPGKGRGSDDTRLIARRAAIAAALSAWSTESAANTLGISDWHIGLFLIGCCGILACMVVPFLGRGSGFTRRLLIGTGWALLNLALWVLTAFVLSTIARPLNSAFGTLIFLMLLPWILPVVLFFRGRPAL